MMKPTLLRWVAIAALMAGGTFSVAANPPAAPPVSYGVEEDVFHPVRATHGMVASVDALATKVGVDILKQGGNAVDAAVAVGYALAVTHPQAGNLGGGGFMMLRTKDGKTTAIDFREMAPAQASRDMFLDDQATRTVKIADLAPCVRYAGHRRRLLAGAGKIRHDAAEQSGPACH
ncbi:gamma-glutamyltranspeptidase [Enterobacter cloacae]|uniref:Gamma-glutamyltranspeptidase n=1 Tax=Enterobacter cloacae TaxID=550 RepID=A0A377LT50_ENTCL|nr:gamma-glutamyltranspeptidase [Enterobacter cloacae]